ncbi:MAG TPA: TolC family protein [Bryobacteraceae bacterium]|jgi:outer membrane protein|nr:TolC family protein [Bryobacteraceae bacterium]
MRFIRNISVFALAVAAGCWAQTPEITIETGPGPRGVGPLLRPFHLERRVVSPAKLTNTSRLESLIRAGNLYLSAQDVIALALENNVDIAIQRYGPYLAREVVRRAQGGGALRDIGQPINAGPTSVSLEGVSVNGVGLQDSGSGGVGSGGGIVVQYGAQPPPLDPLLYVYTNFGHSTSPESNLALSLVPSLIQDYQTYAVQYQQSYLTGTFTQLTYSSTRNRFNSPLFNLNPFTSGDLDLQVNQNLLQGFGIGVNNRNIRVAKNNLKVTDIQLKLQVITTVSAVLNLYWDLVSFNEDLRIKQEALTTAQQLYDGNKRQVELGTLPAIEATRAAAEVSTAKENLLIAQTNVAQQETVLKNALSRNGVVSQTLDEVHVLPLDHITVPETEDLKATTDLINVALAQRPEIAKAKINIESNIINLRGSRNYLLPTLQANFELTNNGLSGPVNAASLPYYMEPPPAAYVGGYGNLLRQVFGRDYPNYSAGFSLNIPFRNRVAQADYVADQLQLRQNQLLYQKATAQIRVDVKNAVIGLQQARAQYETAVATRSLAQQTLEAEQNRFRFGESTIATVVQAQRDLATDQSAEVHAMANYTHAKVAFDEAIGQTLDVNNISMEEAAAGRVARESSIPESATEPRP